MAALSLVTGILAIALGSVDGQLVQQKALADLQPGDTNQVQKLKSARTAPPAHATRA